MDRNINKKKLYKVAKGLLNLEPVQHKKPKDPTKEELNKHFVMTIDKSGNPSIEEV